MRKIKLMPNDYILKKAPDVSWLKWFQMLWNDFEWPVVILLGVISIILGTVGFFLYNTDVGQSDTLSLFWNNLYLSLQLFSMQVSFDAPKAKDISLALQIARFLSPGLTVYTLSQAFIEVFRKQLELFQLVRSENHVVLCGLGSKGLLLVKDLRKEKQSVVIIEQQSNNPYLELCRELGVVVIIGDALDSKILLKAGVRQAKRLIAVCGDDGTNVQVAAQARKLVEGHRKDRLICNIHIVDRYLRSVLKQKEFTSEKLSAFRIELFNVYDVGARVLLRETFNVNQAKAPHLLVIGLGDLGENIVVHAARAWCLGNRNAKEKLNISVLDPDAERKVEMLRILFPLLKDVCEFHTQEYQPSWPELQTALFPFVDPKFLITHAYVCFDDTLLGMQAGFYLLQMLHHQGVQVMIRMNDDSGLANILRETINPDLENLTAFGLLENTCRVGLLHDGSHVARAIHEDYLAREKEKGTKNNPNIVPWNDLAEDIKESNRRQADHIGVKLAAVGCAMEPWREYGKEKFTFKPEEIFKMAKMEHERWRKEKLWENWKYGAERKDARKIHPDLVEWGKLTDDAREKDLATVKLIPILLARAGFQIYRLD